ncbi:hypothetical protein Tco_0062690, partial [Tanacetum coccineum]
RAIPDAMAWRHHDFDVNDPFPDNDFSALALGPMPISDHDVFIPSLPFPLKYFH